VGVDDDREIALKVEGQRLVGSHRGFRHRLRSSVHYCPSSSGTFVP